VSDLLSDLLSGEAAADSYYGFPPGTMAALGASESSQGTNLGSLGNIFQVTPATAAQPGYGLSSVNGNDPMSTGAYLSALFNGPGQGNMASTMSLYQTGYPNPGYTGNPAMAGFLGSLTGGGGAGGVGGATSLLGGAGGGSGGSGGSSSSSGTKVQSTSTTDCFFSPACWFTTLENWAAPLAGRAALILLAVMLIIGAALLFAARTIEDKAVT
jgi:hypothetical protein